MQYHYHSKSLGKERKISGSRLGLARNRATGRVTKFTLRGIGAAMRLVREGTVKNLAHFPTVP